MVLASRPHPRQAGICALLYRCSVLPRQEYGNKWAAPRRDDLTPRLRRQLRSWLRRGDLVARHERPGHVSTGSRSLCFPAPEVLRMSHDQKSTSDYEASACGSPCMQRFGYGCPGLGVKVELGSGIPIWINSSEGSSMIPI